jgi:general secretion pathway protein D
MEIDQQGPGPARTARGFAWLSRIAGRRRVAAVSLGMMLGVMLLSGMAMTSAHAQSASTWDKRGRRAEARSDYDEAFEEYRQAHLKKPSDLRYRTHYQSMRFKAAEMHVDRGRVLRQSGDAGGAINEFARALQIDPGNQSAAQELQVMEKRTVPGGGPAAGGGAAGVGAGAGGGGAGGASPGNVLVPGMGEQTPYQAQMQREIGTLGGPVALQPVSDDPITLHMVEDTKVVYQAICKAAGLNVIFDPEYVAKRIPVDLNSISLPDALHIVGVLSGTFWKPVTSNTIFVAQNTRAKRTEDDDLAVQTFYLTNVSQQNDANEIMVAIRNLLDPGLKIYLVASQNALVIRGTPDELILAEKIINDLDRTKAEVVVDVAELDGHDHNHRERDVSDDGGDYAEHAGKFECDELRGVGGRRDGECAADGLGYANFAEPADQGDGRAALDAEDRVEDSGGDGIVLGGNGDYDGVAGRADAVYVSGCGREYRHDADGAL